MPSKTIQPKILQQYLLRTALLLFTVAALIWGILYYKSVGRDISGLRTTDTRGDIAAIQLMKNGQRAVILKGGKIIWTSSWKEGNTDRDIVWDPAGNFLFFASDRTGQTFHIFRWSPSEPDADMRTTDQRSRTKLTFAVDYKRSGAVPRSVMESGLVLGGGVIQSFDPTTGNTPQLLPPENENVAHSAGGPAGTTGSFDAMYKSLGQSFQSAQWAGHMKYVVALMNRDEENGNSGQVLVIQRMQPDPNGNLPGPVAVAAGDQVQYAINPSNGAVVFAVEGWAWPDPTQVPPQFIKGNQLLTPYRQELGYVTLGDTPKLHVVAATKTDQIAFGSPAVSPDGSQVAVVVGPYSSDQGLEPAELDVMPLQDSGARSRAVLAKGEVYEPSWAPSGRFLVFARRDRAGSRSIYQVGNDGANLTNLTAGMGDFKSPLVSPQIP